MLRPLAVCVLVGLLIAGCSSPKEDDDGIPDPTITQSNSSMTASTTTSGGAGPYTIVLSNFPEVALGKGAAFSFHSSITGPAGSSDHIGAHFGKQAAPNPTVGAYTGSCEHFSADLPGEYSIVCTAPTEAGTYYLRGHVRTGTAPDQTHSWSSEKTFTVA